MRLFSVHTSIPIDCDRRAWDAEGEWMDEHTPTSCSRELAPIRAFNLARRCQPIILPKQVRNQSNYYFHQSFKTHSSVRMPSARIALLSISPATSYLSEHLIKLACLPTSLSQTKPIRRTSTSMQADKQTSKRLRSWRAPPRKHGLRRSKNPKKQASTLCLQNASVVRMARGVAKQSRLCGK